MHSPTRQLDLNRQAPDHLLQVACIFCPSSSQSDMQPEGQDLLPPQPVIPREDLMLEHLPRQAQVDLGSSQLALCSAEIERLAAISIMQCLRGPLLGIFPDRRML